MAAKTALVLSGGGSRGAYQAGSWQALHESGFRPDLIVGTSVGAINGAMIASGLSPQDIHGWWAGLRGGDVVRRRKDLWRFRNWDGLRSAEPLRRLINEHLDFAALRRSRVPFRVTAVDLTTARERVFGHEVMTVDHLLASTALLPGIPPVWIDGRPHADGGHWTAFPLRHALEAGATAVQALLHDPLEPHDEPPPVGVQDHMRRMSDIIWHGRQAAEMEALRARTRLPRRDPLRLRPFDLHVHAPDPPLRNQLLVFEPAVARRLYDRGLEETRLRLEAL